MSRSVFLKIKFPLGVLIVAMFLSTSFLSLSIYAADFSSTNYMVRDPIMNAGGGTNTSSGFQNFGSIGEFVQGESTGTSFVLDTGWAYTVANGIQQVISVVSPTPPSVSPSPGPNAPSDVPVSDLPVKKPTVIKFLGKTYPEAKVFVVKDGKLGGEFTSNKKGEFDISIADLTAGKYNFLIYSRDYQGNKSENLTRVVEALKEKTVEVKDIVFKPGLYLSKSGVKHGDNITIFGQTLFEDKVTITLNGDEVIVTSKAGENGVYFNNLDTGSLSQGDYKVRVRTQNGLESEVLSFIVGEENLPFHPAERLKGDLNGGGNGDGVVNLVDFSILAYWYGKKLPNSVKILVDLNVDGVLNLKDFSLLASNWTG